ncbi:MAG: FadR family transcriptional regulator [Chloroflexi bacterium]|nr:FadR family transcriptional regulator [Chloroflexota bacterium]
MAQARSASAERRTDRVTRAVHGWLLDGQFRPGEHLPSEKALAEQLGVSRNAVREALRGLESVGLLEIRRGAGGGAFVRQASSRLLNDALYTVLRLEGFEVHHLHEARLLLEPGVAAAAAERATPLGVAELERTLERSHAALAAGGPMAMAIDLHGHLARMTGNPIVELLLGLLTDLLETSRTLRASPIDTSPAAGEHVLSQHRAIVEAIASRAPARAESLMRAHLQDISEIESAVL